MLSSLFPPQSQPDEQQSQPAQLPTGRHVYAPNPCALLRTATYRDVPTPLGLSLTLFEAELGGARPASTHEAAGTDLKVGQGGRSALAFPSRTVSSSRADPPDTPPPGLYASWWAAMLTLPPDALRLGVPRRRALERPSRSAGGQVRRLGPATDTDPVRGRVRRAGGLIRGFIVYGRVSGCRVAC